MKDKVMKKATETVDNTKRIIENAEHFVLAVSLMVCAIYNYYDLTIRAVGSIEYYVRIAAAVVIGLKGSWEAIRFFAKQNSK